MVKQITSIHNPEIKNLLNLQEKARDRKKSGLFVVEGVREIELAMAGGYFIEKLYFVPDLVPFFTQTHLFQSTASVVEITSEVYRKVAYRDSTEGIIAIAQSKLHTLNEIVFNTENPLILIAESPEKPGNIGALLRTADAAGVDAVIIADPTTDFYNPNVIRSSVGGIFTNALAEGTTPDIIEFLKNNKFQILTAAFTQNAVSYLTQDYTKPTAIIVGTESSGLTSAWLEAAHQSIIIPMNGKIDSMNVSVSAAILVFEAVRQREMRGFLSHSK